MSEPIKFIADCRHVREVSLYGTADLRFWTKFLENEKLRPAQTGDRAQVLIVGGNMRYMGVEFTEVSFSVLLGCESGHQDAFLVHAFNSSRWFTFCERTFFSTPYRHAQCHLSLERPVGVEVRRRGETLFEATIGNGQPIDKRKFSESDEDSFEGRIFLPNGKGKQKSYVAQLSGRSHKCSFLPDEDTLVIRPSACGMLRCLIDSSFTASSWLIRHNARHARSKTFTTPLE